MPLSLMMDVLIIVLLAATIFYAYRLSKHLNAFRANRSDMERLIRDLSTQITRAQEGITTLDDVAKDSSDELRKLVDRAVGLSDELQIITESGNSLATRLEALATKNKELSDQVVDRANNLIYPGGNAGVLTARPEKSEPPPAPAKKSFFAIRDRDYPSDDISDDDDGLQSTSERQLAAALRRKGKGDNK